MITIGMNYKVIPGKGETFEKAFNKVLEVMKNTDGHSRSFLYKDVNDGQSYMIASEWRSLNAYTLLQFLDRLDSQLNPLPSSS